MVILFFLEKCCVYWVVACGQEKEMLTPERFFKIKKKCIS